MHKLLAFSLVFTAYLSNPVKSPSSLATSYIACSARISVDTQTDRQTERLTLAAHARRGLMGIIYTAKQGLSSEIDEFSAEIELPSITTERLAREVPLSLHLHSYKPLSRDVYSEGPSLLRFCPSLNSTKSSKQHVT